MKPVFSVIVPVFRESARIGETLRRLYALPGAEDLECIVVDGCPAASTLRAIGDPRVIKLRSPRGRGRQMNRGAAAARGAVYLFLHADTRLPADALARVRQVVAPPAAAVAGAFQLGIDAPAKAYRVIEAAVKVRTRLLRMPYGDQAIFIKSGMFQRLGGFREIPLMEDVDLIRRLKKEGKRIAVLPRPVKTSPRRWEREGIVFCTLRNWTLVTLYRTGCAPEVLARFYK